jgi:transposase
MYVCRKSDPETKGKIENVIKYVKLRRSPSMSVPYFLLSF